MIKKCSKCNINDSLGYHTYCKKCKNEAVLKTYAKNKAKGWEVYYLPEEHYVGITNNWANRKGGHVLQGNHVLDKETIYITTDVTFASLLEAMLHNIGYRGNRFTK